MWCSYVFFGIWAVDLVAVITASRTAFLEIVICEYTSQGSSVYSYVELQGTFANIGSLNNAQGDVLQIHPLGLCNISKGDTLYEDEWVGVVKLTAPSQESQACNGTIQKALGAMSKGAKAVIFDITDSPAAATELNSKKALIHHPVVIISSLAAQKLMKVVNKKKVLRVKISCQPDVDQTKDSSSEYVDMVIFMTCFVLITLTCFMLLLKIKWKQSKKESSLAKMAFDAVSRMESKKYKEKSTGVEPVKTIKEKLWERTLSIHSCSVLGISCVICLEEFKEGQEIRVVSCGHEFHLKCVDPWLLTNYTCPLCMLNIVEREGKGIKTESRCTPSFRSLFHCCFASNPLSSSSMVYSVTQEDIPNDGLSIVSNDAAESLQFNQLCTNTSHNLWDEHLVANPAMQEKQNCISYMSSEDATYASVSSIENSDKDIPQVSVNRLSLSIQAGFPGVKQTKHWQKQLDSRTRAVQVADIGTRKYVQLGDTV